MKSTIPQHGKVLPWDGFHGILKDNDDTPRRVTGSERGREGTYMKKNRASALQLAQGAAIAALYVVLTLIFAPISFGEMQVRISEALTILPLFTPAAIPGLFVGCVLGNLLGGAIPLDVIFGSLATLIGAVGGYLLRKNRWLVPLPTVLSNTIIVPFVLRYGYGVELPIVLMMVYVAVGEIISCYGLGELLATVLQKHPTIFGNKAK